MPGRWGWSERCGFGGGSSKGFSRFQCASPGCFGDCVLCVCVCAVCAPTSILFLFLPCFYMLWLFYPDNSDTSSSRGSYLSYFCGGCRRAMFGCYGWILWPGWAPCLKNAKPFMIVYVWGLRVYDRSFRGTYCLIRWPFSMPWCYSCDTKSSNT